MMSAGMRRAIPGLLLLVRLAGAMGAPGDLPPEVLRLAHFKLKMQEVLAQVPNYTCLETIQRYGSERRGDSLRALDAVLLEISYVGGKELLAWPGERRFRATDLDEFAAGGMMGSGLFADLARSALLEDTTTIKYSGVEEIGGRPVARYDFREAAAWSGYQIRANGATATVGDDGSFWIDPGTLELVRLEGRAAEIPAELGIRSSVTLIDYARMRLGGNDVLLPQSAQLLMVLTSGTARRNDVAFSHCRAYASESSLRFDMPAAETQGSAPAVQRVNLPARLTVVVELQTAIDSRTSHVGDPLQGRVAGAVRYKGRTLIPKGALVTGRIRGLRRVRPPGTGVELTIELAELQWDNSHAEFYGELAQDGSAQRGEPPLGSADPGGGMRTATSSPVAAETPPAGAPRIPGTGVLRMEGTHFRIGPGYKTTWRTLEPNQRREK